MKLAMYTSALAISVALAGCSSSNSIPTTGTPDPTPAVGNKITYDNNADDRTKNLTRAGRVQLAQETGPGTQPTEEGNLQTAVDNRAEAQSLRAELAAIGTLDTQGKILDAQALVNAFAALDGTEEDYTTPVQDDLAGILASMNNDINDGLQDTIETNETLLAQAYINAQGGTQLADTRSTITLADGTQLSAESMGFAQTNANGAFVSSSVVAAYEQDELGRITRVAFVETDGSDFVPGSGVGNYEASGRSTFAVQVDGGFFDILEGGSSVNLNLGSESGNVSAQAGGRDSNGGAIYQANVLFNPSTGEFTSSNGEFAYAPNGILSPSNTNVLSAQNAQLLGKLHGEVGSEFGADYTGLVTVNTDRMGVVGTIIGQEIGSTPQ